MLPVLAQAPGDAKSSPFDVTSIYHPPNGSLQQSRKFAAGIAVSEALKNDFQAVDLKVGILDSGQFCSSAPSTVVNFDKDRKLKALLSRSIVAGRKEKNSIISIKQLGLLVAKLLTPNDSSDLTTAHNALDIWYDTWSSTNAGRQFLLGFFVDQHKGACQQRAVLLKILCDKSGYSTRLVPGYLGSTRHVWLTATVNGKELIFDPTLYVMGETNAQRPLYRSAEVVFGKNTQALVILLPAICKATDVHDCRALVGLYQRLIKIDTESFGAEHLELSTDHHNLACAYCDLKMNELAECHFRKSLEIKRRFLKSDHPAVLQTEKLLELVRNRRDLENRGLK